MQWEGNNGKENRVSDYDYSYNVGNAWETFKQYLKSFKNKKMHLLQDQFTVKFIVFE